ncbi:hypothetical protein Tco_0025216 [Tanacetum coccineum]
MTCLKYEKLGHFKKGQVKKNNGASASGLGQWSKDLSPQQGLISDHLPPTTAQALLQRTKEKENAMKALLLLAIPKTLATVMKLVLLIVFLLHQAIILRDKPLHHHKLDGNYVTLFLCKSAMYGPAVSMQKGPFCKGMLRIKGELDRDAWGIGAGQHQGRTVTTLKMKQLSLLCHGLHFQLLRVDTVGNPQQALKNKGIFNSGCSRHMTRNKDFFTD